MTELQAVAAEEIYHAAWEMLRAFKHHVFREVRNATFVVLFYDRASLYQQVEEGLLCRLVALAYIICQSVRQHAFAHCGVFGNYLFVNL